MEGGAMAGYCAIGNERIASAPATMRTMAITQAKIGRLMKNLDMMKSCLQQVEKSARSRKRNCRRWSGICRNRLYFDARVHPLQARDNHAIAGHDACAHQPLIAHGPLGGEHSLLDFVARADEHRHRSASRVAAHRNLWNKKRIRTR